MQKYRGGQGSQATELGLQTTTSPLTQKKPVGVGTGSLADNFQGHGGSAHNDLENRRKGNLSPKWQLLKLNQIAFSIYLFICLHFDTISDRELIIPACVDRAMMSFSDRQRSHLLDPPTYGWALVTISHFIVYGMPASCNSHTSFDSSVAFLLLLCLKVC